MAENIDKDIKYNHFRFCPPGGQKWAWSANFYHQTSSLFEEIFHFDDGYVTL